MKKLFLAIFLLGLAACEMPQDARMPPAEGALYAPMPARGTNGREDFSTMRNPAEVTPCGYTSLLLYKCGVK